MQVDHIRNDFVHIPFSTSVQEGGSFSVAEGVNFGFSRTFDEVGRFPAWNDREFPGKRRPVCRVAAPHHRKCGRTYFEIKSTSSEELCPFGEPLPACRLTASKAFGKLIWSRKASSATCKTCCWRLPRN